MNDKAKTTADLIGDLSQQLTQLVRDEMRLATLELARKGRRAGFGAGLFGAAGLAAFFGGATLIAALVLALALVMPAWAAACLVAGVLFVVAAILGLTGKRQVERATPLKPEQTIESVKADVDEVKARARR
ncbi:phage holin family protein [Nonomuraea sp. NPDC050663]|uniref:Putative membrane protein YqjE n=1 Tax=Nonomuraea soli TaxID=1032476 RepID=A0A7W0HT87_9ACTN|nr:phage holin family protein [Nonomuraea soli]MBA2894863.1 putative membrane protein YqjE [Nonomuraea soli]